MLYIDATYLYDHSKSQPLPCDEIKVEKNIGLKEKLVTQHDNEIGYFVEVDLKYPDSIKEKTKIFPISQEIKKN